MARVLLTGGTGFIGRYAAGKLRAAGFDVHAVGRRPIPGAAFHPADLKDAAATAAAVADVRATHLLHLAWDVTHGQFWTSRENLDWVAASLLLYRAFAAAGGRRLCVTGTCAEYDWSAGQLDANSTPLLPSTLYGTAKHALHTVLASAAAADGVELAWGRVFFAYGPGEAPARLVPSAIRPLLRGEPAALGDCLGQRDFMHAEDVAAALVAVLASGHVGAADIASGTCRPMRAIAELAARQIGQPGLLHFGERPAASREPPVLATQAATLRDLGFRPAYTLETGMEDTIAWWRAQDSLTA